MSALLIADTVVRSDEHTRYCLNDLHKASGGKARHAPALWLRSRQARELISEVESGANHTNPYGFEAVVKETGRAGGTYVCDDLLIAYANWISAKFYLRVIRAFKGQLGIDVKSRDIWVRRRIALEKREAVSKEQASIGGSWMAKHRHAKRGFKAEEALITQAIQPRLFLDGS